MNSRHWDIGGIENSVVYGAAKVLNGLPLYGDPESANFDITQYTPLYYHCLTTVARLTDVNPMENLHGLYLIGRSLSLAFNLLGAWVVYRTLIAVFEVDSRLASIASVLSFLTLSDFHFAARPDSLFFLTGTVVVYCFSAYLTETRSRERGILFALGILAAAISVFVKQTGVQYVGFIPLFFLSQRRYRDFLFSSVSLPLATIGFYLLFRSIHGPFFDKNIIGGLNNGTSFVAMAELLTLFLLRHQTWVILGAIATVHVLSNREESRSTRFLALLALWLFIFAAGTSLKRGSWLNYYTDFLNTLLILTAIRMDRLWKHAWWDEDFKRLLKALSTACLAICLPSLLVQTLGPKWRQHFPRAGKAYAQTVEMKRPAAEYLRAHLTEGQYLLAFDRHVELMLADRAVMPNKEIIPSEVNYDYKGFYNAVDNGTIRYFLLAKTALGERFMGIDYSRFPKVYEDGSFVILENNH